MTVHTMRMPDLGEGIVEAEVVDWLIAVGDAVTPETPIVEVLTDKATVEVNAPVAGVVAEIVAEAGAMVTVGSDLVRIRVSPSEDRDAQGGPPGDDDPLEVPREPMASGPLPPQSWPPPGRSVPEGAPPRPLAAPTVRRLARTLGVDLAEVSGTGPGGRVLREDLEAHRLGGRAAPTGRVDSEEHLRGVRRTIARRLSAAWEVPHITYVEEVDVSELESFRATLNAQTGDDGGRFTPLTFIARAVVLACGDHPRMNATFDDETEILHLHAGVHLGIATQTDRGLLVPVVRDAEARSLGGLTEEIHLAAQSARDGSADRDRLGGSTITVTSLGALGGLMNTPILNAPEVAIVGVNKMRTAPHWNGAAFEPRRMLNLSASFDHRVVDGWDAAVFVQRMRELLETPALLTLGWER